MKSLGRVTLCADLRRCSGQGRLADEIRLVAALLLYDPGHRARILIPHRIESGDDARAVGGGSVLAHLPFASDVEDLDLDADDRPALHGDELRRRVADRPGPIAPPFERPGQFLDLPLKP